jgi:hypothetical protein
MTDQHPCHPPRKSEPCTTARRQQSFHDHPVCTRLLRGAVLKGYATAACIGFFSLWTKAK